MRWGIFSSVVLCTLLLTGCAAPAVDSGIDDLMTTTVDSTATPGFVAEVQDEEDVISDFDVTSFGIDAGSTRYQGEWEGFNVYLGVSGTYTVNFISVSLDNPEEWGSGHSIGNSVIGMGEPISLQYLPQGTSVVPEGWHPLSDWIIVRD